MALKPVVPVLRDRCFECVYVYIVIVVSRCVCHLHNKELLYFFTDAVKQKQQVIEPCVTVPPPPVSTASQAPTVPSGVTAGDAVTTAARVTLSVLADDRVEPITGIRKAMAKTMTRAQQVPHFGYADEVLALTTCLELLQLM